MLSHNYIGTEHILLGLIHEGEGVAAQALESLDVSLEAVRQDVKKLIGQGQRAPSGHIPFTPRAKKVLELSLREALQLGHNYIGTEHILLGLIREGEGVAAQVLVRLGADLSKVRQQVTELLHGREESPSGPPRTSPGKRYRARQMEAALARIESLDKRLAGIERWIGMRPDLGDLDKRLARIRLEKERAIDAQDFETAARLRDTEKELTQTRAGRERDWAQTAGRRKPLSDVFSALAAEVGQLRAQLRGGAGLAKTDSPGETGPAGETGPPAETDRPEETDRPGKTNHGPGAGGGPGEPDAPGTPPGEPAA
jgi:ATP-dependent Clp protease ATP-binding subunit ClpA